MGWTEDARMEFQRYLDDVRSTFDNDELADPHIEALRARIESGVQERFPGRVDTKRLRWVLQSMDIPGSEACLPSMTKTALIFSSALLSYFVLLVESTTHMCAEQFFDPIPTRWHAALVFFVPTSQIILIFATWSYSKPARWRGFISGIGLGAAAYFSMMFLPLIPLSVLGLALGGMGLLSLSPLIAFWASWALNRRLWRLDRRKGPHPSYPTWLGLIFGVLFLPLMSSGGVLATIGIDMASSTNLETRAHAVAF